MPERVISIAFLRPRMGIGGSERLVTDAAVALKRRGHRVTLYVPDREDEVQFPELAEHQIPFRNQGSRLPSSIAGRLRAPMAIVRTGYAGWHMSRAADKPDIVFSDVVAHVIPMVKRLARVPVLYFCHYPDLLLTSEGGRASSGYRAYRRPLDRLEELGIAAADLVVANSRFTAGIVRTTFPALPRERMAVLYPGVAVPTELPEAVPETGEIVIVSVNRFDPRKNLSLAVDALRILSDRVPVDLFAKVRLILAGYHDGLTEARSLVGDLRQQAASAGLSEQVTFEFSPSEQERRALVARSRCVIYTPTAEHFGYVPVEAMAAGRAVVAVNNGGPAETVLQGKTGWLCAPTPDAFGEALATLVSNAGLANTMGRMGYEHVARNFALEAFGDGLEALVRTLTE